MSSLGMFKTLRNKENVHSKTVSSAGIVQYQQHQGQGAGDYPECHFAERHKESLGPG